ncbi:hypothetical protein Q9966_015681 [Columba livia]|nr:hypothetical protein Q9966_015681 [Columba livia]
MCWTPSCSSTASSSPSSTVASGSWFTASRSNEPARRQKKLFTPDSAERARRCTRPSSTNSPDPPAMSPLVIPPGPPHLGLRWRTGAFSPGNRWFCPKPCPGWGCRGAGTPGAWGGVVKLPGGAPPVLLYPPFFCRTPQ